jgi:hypothetical protein
MRHILPSTAPTEQGEGEEQGCTTGALAPRSGAAPGLVGRVGASRDAGAGGIIADVGQDAIPNRGAPGLARRALAGVGRAVRRCPVGVDEGVLAVADCGGPGDAVPLGGVALEATLAVAVGGTSGPAGIAPADEGLTTNSLLLGAGSLTVAGGSEYRHAIGAGGGTTGDLRADEACTSFPGDAIAGTLLTGLPGGRGGAGGVPWERGAAHRDAEPQCALLVAGLAGAIAGAAAADPVHAEATEALPRGLAALPEILSEKTYYACAVALLRAVRIGLTRGLASSLLAAEGPARRPLPYQARARAVTGEDCDTKPSLPVALADRWLARCPCSIEGAGPLAVAQPVLVAA